MTFHASLPGGRRRRPLSQDEINTTVRRTGNIVNTLIEPFKPEVTRRDLSLDGSLGDNADNARREVFAVKLLLPLAEAGDPKAQLLPGYIYDLTDGTHGVKRDNTKARFWYEKAVKQDYTPAFRELGRHLNVREDMTKSQIAEPRRRARAWLKAHGEKL